MLNLKEYIQNNSNRLEIAYRKCNATNVASFALNLWFFSSCNKEESSAFLPVCLVFLPLHCPRCRSTAVVYSGQGATFTNESSSLTGTSFSSSLEMAPWTLETVTMWMAYVFQVLMFICLDFCFPQHSRFYWAVQKKDCLFMIFINLLYMYLFNSLQWTRSYSGHWDLVVNKRANDLALVQLRC